MATPVTSVDSGADVPEEVRAGLSGLALAGAGANVVMQLAQLSVGHGVTKSRVESGRIDRHPLKRTRTTLNVYLWDTRRRIREGRPIV